MIRARILASLLLGAVLVLGPTAVLPVAAADVTFGQAQSTATYDQSIQFTIPMTSESPVDRVELRLRFPDTIGPTIVDVPVPPGSGTQTLRYTLDLTGDAHLVPNTAITATWAAFPTAGGQPVLSSPDRVLYEDTTEQWKTVSGDLMTVHWYAGSESFARRALEIGEKAVRDTSALLGVTETDPIDFFIYGDDGAFRDALGPGTRENVGGQAHSDIRTLFALITPDAIDDPWVGIVIPHELTHLVFDTAVHNPYRFPPRWLNEGLAVYLSQGYDQSDRGMVQDAVSAKDLMPLNALGGQFPTEPDKTSLAYAESVSAIDHLVRTYGRDQLFALVKAYHDGLTDDEAFQRALGVDLAGFQAGWLQELGASVPQQYGPQAAPPGPLPPGWSGPPNAPAPGLSPAPTSAPGAPGPSTAPTTGEAAADDPLAGGGGVGVLLAVLVVAAGFALLFGSRRLGRRA